jgi:hypothetical protein
MSRLLMISALHLIKVEERPEWSLFVVQGPHGWMPIVDFVGEGGFEPPHPFGHWLLKPACLPFHHSPVGAASFAVADQG